MYYQTIKWILKTNSFVLFKYIYSPSFGSKLSYQSVVDSIYAQSYLAQEILDLRDIFFSEFTQD